MSRDIIPVEVRFIMRRERAKPIVIMQAAEKRMLHPISSKIAIPTRLQDRKGSLALLEKTREHRFAIIEMPTRIYLNAQSRDIARYLSTPARFTENTLHAIERYYEPAWNVGGVVFYRPKAAG